MSDPKGTPRLQAGEDVSSAADALLAQLADLRRRVEEGDRAEALAAIDGLRRTVLLGVEAATPTPLPESGQTVDLDALANAARLADAVSGKQVPGLSATRRAFGEDVDCWGWHAPQQDARGRRYRWCGGAPEAGIVLRPTDDRDVRGFAFRVRLATGDLATGSFRARIDGAEAPFMLTEQPDGHHVLVIGRPPWRDGPVRTVSFDVLKTIVPRKAGLSTDGRNLLFNVFEIVEIAA